MKREISMVRSSRQKENSSSTQSTYVLYIQYKQFHLRCKAVTFNHYKVIFASHLRRYINFTQPIQFTSHKRSYSASENSFIMSSVALGEFHQVRQNILDKFITESLCSKLQSLKGSDIYQAERRCYRMALLEAQDPVFLELDLFLNQNISASAASIITICFTLVNPTTL